MEDSTSTLTIEGFTPYAQVPRWVVRSEGALSGNAVHLYGVLMSYADNGTKAAFPSRSRLARDMGRSVNTVKRAMAELEAYGALKVERRRSKVTGANISNMYTLVFADPRATREPRVGPQVSHELHSLSTTPTSPIAVSVPESQRSSLRSPSLSERRTDRDLLDLVREIVTAQDQDEYEAASDRFLEEFEQRHGYELGYWDYGWSEKLLSLCKKHGIDYGTAKWLGIFTNSQKAA